MKDDCRYVSGDLHFFHPSLNLSAAVLQVDTLVTESDAVQTFLMQYSALYEWNGEHRAVP